MELKPSKEIWDYTKGNITVLFVCSAIADKLGGFHISYTANEVLKDLGLLSNKGNPNKKAKEVLALYLHGRFHGGREQVAITPPG